MWSDNETTQDLLGFRIHSDLIKSIIINKSLLPVTIGVFGDWGSGKSSIMKMLEHDLDSEKCGDTQLKEKLEKIACLYFNGWLFEGYDDAKSAILTSIVLQLGEHKRFGPKVRDGAAALLKSINLMRVAKLGIQYGAIPAIAAYATGGASAVPALVTAAMTGLGAAVSKENAAATAEKVSSEVEKINWSELINKDKSEASPLDVRTFRERFAKLLADSNVETLVVLIDDLDRCSPERIVENLEAIKLFLNVENTVFVIGADPRIVRHAISAQFKDMKINNNDAEQIDERLIVDYLEKLVQIPYYLPKLSPTEIETYMSLLFCSKEFTPDLMAKVLMACDTLRTANRYTTFGLGNIKEAVKGTNLSASLAENLSFCSRSSHLITEGLKGNPRQVKRFLNSFILRQEIAKVAKLTHVNEPILVKLMILEYCQPDAFRKIFELQSKQDGLSNEIKELEKTAKSTNDKEFPEALKKYNLNWNEAFFKKWFSIEPFLENIDLRDYFWLARDRLDSTLNGITFVSPIVRKLFEDLIGSNPGKKHSATLQITGLQSNELQALLDLMKKALINQPEQKNFYDAFRALVEKDVPLAINNFADALNVVPEEKIPPGAALDLSTLTKSKNTTSQFLAPIVEKVKASDTLAGRALKKG